ncbi:MAG: ATP-binding protein [Sedimentisphaerales bacterium]|nr:ATP-binding protein [Sedimentisphaerales bacterium]
MWKVEQSEDCFSLQMPATRSSIDRADDRFTAFLQERRFPTDSFALRLLLRESLLNAVDHGGRQDPCACVSFTCTADRGGMTLQVRDPGPGFNWREQGTDIDHLQEGGRGLALMRLYSDNLQFNDAGNQVTMYISYKFPPESDRYTLGSSKTERIEHDDAHPGQPNPDAVPGR